MRHRSALVGTALGLFGSVVLSTSLWAQAEGAAWRGAGARPCFGAEGGSHQCPQPPGSIAVTASRLFDGKTGRMLAHQTVLISNDRIVQVGASQEVKPPPGTRMIY